VALVAALVAARAGVMVRRKTCPVVWQVYDALVVLASAVFMLVLNAWNLIGFKLS
jgi:hypothetical protein